ncbi:ATPase domain-containing protein [uncultured Methanoregula sp.]|uniref:RAD55 family ATPase n=1 Tax=uncultured Methanoregula sp. TaxID=1005933 RepID=UPI002AAA80E2|nr:ATPase domain-containing protein [uncultured Methanoregula sp.]
MDTRTRIQDLPVSGRTKRRSTGIVGLNLLLDGGFPEGTLIMIYGTAVAGVDLAAKQFWKAEGGEEGTYLMNDGDVEIGMIDAIDLHPEMYLQQMAGSRLVVDSLSTIIIRYGIDGALKFLTLAREAIRNRGANLVFVVYSGIHTPMEITRVMRAADIVIEFKTDVHQSEIERTLAVHKIRNAAAPQRLLPFIITEKGIEASTTSRVV